ncbi:2-polyprenyl-3-methyl-5-hydroxy-6-metoxy-1,4-benzoquinol methylase [Desulfuromonas soudanensis]|uniref:2-polyprenyl-3-methyl-5-hydroxy-6-metoxy-1, 4-benzoquinol methylase n=1 Tax=Desulfuromonas soudanensis TaxID=1603606 RepID=A0A0M4CYU2_9BACT|nr:class I SAM-dependent methyltransferase [Desulfuromonas soudanensis]ALC15034.1 2-polyprenyl-3-methyl-5-hydroxy-6-metoxy-1,4-benzoquinol methylase [Desulfuromonas soudanensis]
MYDFSRCKICAATSAIPVYALRDVRIYVCPACGFHYADYLDGAPLETVPGEGALTEGGRNYMDSRLDENQVQNLSRLNLIRRYCPLAEARCLDVGAGVGTFLDLLGRQGAQGHGIEPSALRREFAGGKYGILLNREPVDKPFWQEGFAGFFDLATLWDVIEHVDFPRETLAAVWRLLRPGGMLFLDTPSREALDYRIGEISYRLSGGQCPLFLETIYARLPYGHKQIFTAGELVELLKGLGFEILQLDSRHEPPAPSIFHRLRPGKGIVVVARKPEN